MEKNFQRQTWEDEFGKEYLQRNIYTPKHLDEFYENRYTLSRTDLNNRFLKNINKDAKILEVGTNIGNQLLHLQSMGFKNLYGIEIQERAINFAIDEIYRVTNSYIWGFEYYAEEYTDLMYQGNKNLMWKADFMKLYKERKKDLVKLDELKVSYTDDKNLIDQMFLLQK